jgi:hypothetical protein
LISTQRRGAAEKYTDGFFGGMRAGFCGQASISRRRRTREYKN